VPLNVHLSLTPSERARRGSEGLEVKGRGRVSKDEVSRLVEDARLWAVDCRNLHYEWARKRWPPA